MIKDPGSGNKPGARDVCGARGEAGLTFYTKNILVGASLQMHTQKMKYVCLDM